MPKISVDKEACQAQGVCRQVAPEVIRGDDHGYAVVLQEEFPESQRKAVEEAALGCPVGAIVMED